MLTWVFELSTEIVSFLNKSTKKKKLKTNSNVTLILRDLAKMYKQKLEKILPYSQKFK